ncbi:uncharacterized protein LOC126770272 [Nymphalis io]|uniref:uncharacterized protein LOC126770272 n=1 Tax=Inachis io TaxID=171585 RepID=UPI00216A2265|nr:uncharacterized protein LOC126770272 [Nymphalis io]
MFASIKTFFKWGPTKSIETKNKTSSLLFVIFVNILEDVLFWKKIWLTLLFFLFFNVVFTSCVCRQLNILQFISGFSILIISIDAFEAWLKYKHRTACLKRLVYHENNNIKLVALKVQTSIENMWTGFIHLRDRNHTKAFLLLQIILTIIMLIGKYISGYTLVYLLCTVIFFLNKLIPPLVNILKKVQQNAESDFELEGLIPEETDVNLDLLSIEPDQKPIRDEKQSLDYWKPEDLPFEEASDSSDNSSSLVTNLSIEKMQTLSKDVEISDSSEDEYMPQALPSEQIQSTLDVQPVGTWSNAAFNVLSNFGGAVANMVYTKDDKKRKRISSVDSSDGFEIIDKTDLQ